MEGQGAGVTLPKESVEIEGEGISVALPEESVEIEGEGTSVALPEELVGRILAMVPFPSVFKARVLSKSWRAKFSSIASQGDENEERLAAAWFQEQVSQWSATNWKTFSPIFFGLQEDFLAYDRTSDRWLRMPWQSSLPKDGWHPDFSDRCLEGPLLLLSDEEGKKMCVTNVLTGSWKRLPDRQEVLYWPETEQRWLISMSADTYKVVVFIESLLKLHSCCDLQIYDSQLGKWRAKRLFSSEDYLGFSERSNIVCLNGVLYTLAKDIDESSEGEDEDGWGAVARPLFFNGRLLAFNVKEESFQVMELESLNIPLNGSLAVCNGSLLMVTLDAASTVMHAASNVVIRKIDLGSGRLLEVAQGPPVALNFGYFTNSPTSGDDCIFFMGEREFSGKDNRRILSYNMLEDEWSSFLMPDLSRVDDPYIETEYEWQPSSFQPGLNPFAGV